MLFNAYKSEQNKIQDEIDYCDFKEYLMNLINVENNVEFETKLKMILLNKDLFNNLLLKMNCSKYEFFETLSKTKGIEFLYNKRFSGTMRRMHFNKRTFDK